MLLLSQLKQYIKEKKKVSLVELQMQFKEDISLIYNMLQHLIRKGQLNETKVTLKCGSKCHQCDPLTTLVFTWL